MSNTFNFDDLVDFAGDVSKNAIERDRSTEKRFWGKLNEIMNAESQDFEKTMPTFIQLVSQFGEIRYIPHKLFQNMNKLATLLNDCQLAIQRATEFPELTTTSLTVYKSRYRSLKTQWNEYITLALQAARIKTEGSMGIVETIALYNNPGGGDFTPNFNTGGIPGGANS